ncbi:hypothetical protein ACH4OW_04580 [Streptomyces sp. NPDC017056]|uniref:hypothetical protein n=1 Tax=Streptomyces sp. NPDC017056 TaxID=3364973 RepID=UPI00379067C4
MVAAPPGAGAPGGGPPVTADVALGALRCLAADRSFGEDGFAGWYGTRAECVRAVLDALLAGVDSPSLGRLAGLGRNELDAVDELFDSVLEELGLVPLTPESVAAARWTMARWWAGRIVRGNLDAVDGARLILDRAACELEGPRPEVFAPFGDVLGELWDEGRGDVPASREQRDALVAAARRLAGGAAPPRPRP